MSTPIDLPPVLPALEPLPATAAAVDAVATDVRAAATTTSDAWSATASRGVPGDWSGLAADTAGYAFARFGRDADQVTAALERGCLALDVYAGQLTELARDRDRLGEDRSEWNTRLDGLLRRLEATAPEADLADLRGEAQRLVEAREDLADRATGIAQRVADAEDRLVRALESVDTDAEATDAAADPERPDVPALLRGLRALGGDAPLVATWWAGLSPAEREALTISHPDLVGSTDGVPVAARDDANRSQLERDADRLAALRDAGIELTDAQRDLLARLDATRQALDAGTTTLDPHTGRPVATYLVLYQPQAFGGDGAAAVAYGNPDTADRTAVMVPGLTNDQTKMAGLGQDALNVMRATGGDASTSVIAWMGYDAPSGAPDSLDDVIDLAGVTGEGKAEDGGHLLSSFVDGLRATHEGDPSHLTVIGHSYGSTTVAHAGQDDGLAADSMVLVGSPGAGDGAEHAGDLGLPPGRVYVGAAEHDFVTWLGGDTELGLGRDPAQAGFGATRFDVDDGTPFHVDEIGTVGLANHSSYFDPETNPTSLDNIASIVRGDEPDVVPGRDEPARDRLADYALSEGGRWVEEGIDRLADLGHRLGVPGR